MCYGQHQPFSPDQSDHHPITSAVAVEDLRGRLAETEARLLHARAREAELSLRLDQMKRYLSVMEILESYLRRRYR